MTPGPREPTADQLQEYLILIVDVLLKLFEEGVRIPTPSCPEGIIYFSLPKILTNANKLHII